VAEMKDTILVAFSGISTGIFDYLNKAAAPIALKTVRDFFAVDYCINELGFCCAPTQHLLI
jgi:O-acetyl-ADP-ribose deacetylase (regulator of RNase III)